MRIGDSEVSKRAIIYARVSRDDSRQEGRNLEGQIQIAQDYAASRGYAIVAVLTEDDKGASGADINLPKLSEVRALASSKAFDVLVVREIDRLSRSLAKQLIVEQELKRSGVRIEYVLGDYPDTPEGNFLRHMRASIAEFEREKINERVIRGRYSKVKAGSVLVSGHAPFGYHLKNANHMYYLEVVESEAEVVRMIFDWYLRGYSVRRIAARLSELGIESYTDRRPSYREWLGSKRRAHGSWGQGSVRHVIMNEIYAGVWYYGKKIGRGGKQKRDKTEQVAVPVPAIISREKWDAAQAMRNSNRSVRKHPSGYDYLLKGCIYCEHCGHRIGARTSHVGGKVYAYYRCNAYRQELAHVCEYSSVHYSAPEVDAAVWNWLATLLTDPDQLRRGLRAYQANTEQHIAPLRERLHLIDEMISTEQGKLDRLLDLYLEGEFPRDILADRRVRLESQIEALTGEATSLRDRIDAEAVSDDEIDMVQQFGKEIAERLNVAGQNAELMQEVIRVVDLQVFLSAYSGDKTVSIRCGIGGEVLSLKNTATYGSFLYKSQRPLP